MTLFSLTLILFLIIDPFGNVISYNNLMKEIPPSKRLWVGLREMGIALLVMLLFNAIGEILFDLLGFCESALRIASGLILFLVAIKILFPSLGDFRAHLPAGEPFIFPLAIPLIAGPAVLATIMLYAHLEPSQPLMLSAIVFAWLAASAILLSSDFLLRTLGVNGLAACDRLLGMILVILAIQRFADGVQLFLTGSCP